MTSIATRIVLVAGIAVGFAIVGLTGPAFSKTKYTCMTDEGNGRYRPCSAGYKAANPNWRGSENCMTDEGNGRYRPCSAGYKAKYKK